MHFWAGQSDVFAFLRFVLSPDLCSLVCKSSILNVHICGIGSKLAHLWAGQSERVFFVMFGFMSVLTCVPWCVN